MSRRGRGFALALLLAGVLGAPVNSVAQEFQATPLEPDTSYSLNVKGKHRRGMTSVLVKLDAAALASYAGGVPGLRATAPTSTGRPLDVSAPDSQAYLRHFRRKQDDFQAACHSAIPGAVVTHSLPLIFGGVAMVVPDESVEDIARLPGVERVYPDELLQLDTDSSPRFIGAPEVWNALGGRESAGEGIVVGVLDSGVWPEHPSFSDPDPSGKAYPAPPASWTGTACQFGSGVPGDAPVACNHKLIGARRFMATYDAVVGLVPGEFSSARDDNGHGTHTASTAAGNARVEASIFGVPRGLVSGMAPRARVAVYKVCGLEGCYISDSAAAVQQAILDGVDVINFSISGGANPYSDAVELAFLDAYNAGVFVAASAGNAGPGANTTDHRGPWVTTVAASTQRRAFVNRIALSADGGASLSIEGTSVTDGVVTPSDVVVPPAANVLCSTPFAPGSLASKIVVCRRGTNGRINKGFNAHQGGAAGMILYNQSAAVTDLETDNHFLPTSQIQFEGGTALLAFLTANTNVKATLTPGEPARERGDVMASFSSRGGPGLTLGVSKPDVTAPGVQILAGHTPLSVDPETGPQGELFQAIAGTSMSSPHVAGAAALLKDLHPDWTPGQIKSALMTSARTRGVVKEDGVTPAGPFDFGSGRIDLAAASRPGLTFDATGAEYVAFRTNLTLANYPSLYVPSMPGKVSVPRTALSVLGRSSWWSLDVDAPRDLKIDVPEHIFLPAGGDETFDIQIDASRVPIGEVRHATIELESHKGGRAQLPVTIVRQQAPVTFDKTCDPASFKRGETTQCTVTLTNPTFDDATVNVRDKMPSPLSLETVTGATRVNSRLWVFSGVIHGSVTAQRAHRDRRRARRLPAAGALRDHADRGAGRRLGRELHRALLHVRRRQLHPPRREQQRDRDRRRGRVCRRCDTDQPEPAERRRAQQRARPVLDRPQPRRLRRRPRRHFDGRRRQLDRGGLGGRAGIQPGPQEQLRDLDRHQHRRAPGRGHQLRLRPDRRHGRRQPPDGRCGEPVGKPRRELLLRRELQRHRRRHRHDPRQRHAARRHLGSCRSRRNQGDPLHGPRRGEGEVAQLRRDDREHLLRDLDGLLQR